VTRPKPRATAASGQPIRPLQPTSATATIRLKPTKEDEGQQHHKTTPRGRTNADRSIIGALTSSLIEPASLPPDAAERSLGHEKARRLTDRLRPSRYEHRHRAKELPGPMSLHRSRFRGERDQAGTERANENGCARRLMVGRLSMSRRRR
jgi:hypothetical protein